MSEEGSITSVERALHLMEALLDGPVGATALAAKLQVSKATAFRLARTLQANGYVVQLDDTRYALGPRCLILSAWAYDHVDIRRELRWAEEELSEHTGETILLSVLSGRDAVCIDSIPSKRGVVSLASVGEIWPLHAGAAGLVFMADDQRLLESYLEKADLAAPTQHTITDPDGIRKLVREAQEKGFAVNRSYWREDVAGVAALVHDASGRAAAALGMIMPEFRLDGFGVETLGALMLDVTSRASERLGFRGPRDKTAR